MRPLITGATWGFCYLLHFAAPLGNLANARAQAQHYIGFAADDGSGAGLEHRIAEHLAGDGARITRAARAQGIAVELVAAWRAPLAFERRLKARKEAPRLCPICARAAGRKTKRPIVPAEQLTLPFEEPVEPWPAGFEFPAPVLTRPVWAEIQAERRARALITLAPVLNLTDEI